MASSSTSIAVTPLPTGSSTLASAIEQPSIHRSRLEELDSLRGLAALLVFVYHCVFLLAVRPAWLIVLVRSPATLFVYGGHQAVMLFFILSGFVLYLPYTGRDKHRSYAAFIAKRVCRIYLPYLAALVFFVAAYLLFFRSRELPGFLPAYGWQPLSTRQLLLVVRDHVFFIGLAHREYLNGATWTLAEEMRISFIFPLLAWAVKRLGAWRSLAAALLCSTSVSVGIHIVHHRSPLETFHYAGLFILGAVLCSNRSSLIDSWQKLRRPGQWMLVMVSILLCGYAPALMTRLPQVVTEEASDWLIAISASVFLISALAGTGFGALLRGPRMRHFGRTSYGIYLLHLPIIFVVANLLWLRVPHLVVFGIAFLITIGLAAIFYHSIERPGMALGKHLAHRIEQRRRSAGRVEARFEVLTRGRN